MDCQEMGPLLDPFVDGQLSAAESLPFREHLGNCAACRNRADELAALSSALAHLPRLEPRAGLAARALAGARRSARPQQALPAWWPALLAAGAAVALVVCVWVVLEALAVFVGAGGGEYLGLIGSYPHLLWRHPADTTLALLGAVPVANLLVGLASALLAGLLAVQLVATDIPGWPRPSSQW